MSLKDYTPEDLATLTPDELQALENDTSGDADDSAVTTGEEQQPAGTDAPADEAPNPTGEEPPADESPADEPAAELEDDAFMIEEPADAEEQRATLTAEKNKAFADLMDGTLSTEEYNAVDNRVSKELQDLASTLANAKFAKAQREHEVKKQWKATLDDFFTTAKAEGADYLKQPELHKEFDGLVKVFASEASAKGMSDVGLAASKYALEQAQMVMRARHGFKSPAKEATAAEKAIEAADAVRRNIKSLSNMPAADRTLTDDSPLAKFNSLQGEAQELYYASLSPADARRLDEAADA